MKKIVLTLIFFLLLAGTIIPRAHAQDAPPPENWVDGDYAGGITGALLSGEMNAPAYASHMQTNFMSDMIRRVMGPIPGVTITADAYQNNPRLVAQMSQGSAVAGFGNYIAMMYANPPADLALWIRDTGQTLGFIPKQAHAQGIGFSGLAPLLPLWKAFRNIAYLLLTLVMLIIGFMVMLRKKIDPKTVVTVQNALPKIIVTLVLITFSYAIVGLLIDLMYLALYFFIGILVANSNGILGPGTSNAYATGGLPVLFTSMFGSGYSAIDDLVRFLNPSATLTSQTFSSIGSSIKFLILFLPTTLISGPIEVIILWLIISIAILIGFIRIIFMLMSSYIQIIISVIIGPLQIITEAFPGVSGFNSWLNNLVSNLIVFPITAVLILISTIITQTDTLNLWAPPLLSSSSKTNGITGLIGLGVLLTIPSIVASIKEALKSKSVIGFGGAFGPATGITTQAISLGSMAWSHKLAKDQAASMQELAKSVKAGQGNIGQSLSSVVAGSGRQSSEGEH